MAWNISLTSKTPDEAKAAVAALNATQTLKNAVVAKIDKLVASDGPNVLVSVVGDGNDADEAPVKVHVTKG